VPSQSLAPHAPPVVQVALQQCVPVPLVPHRPLTHWSFAPHVVPEGFLATHVPLGPGFTQ
jgi:hypothetical protein